METLSQRELELVAIGAAIGSNCVPCIEYHIPAARKVGLTELQIRGAVRLADKVRQIPARKVLETTIALLGEQEPGDSKQVESRCDRTVAEGDPPSTKACCDD